MWHTHKCVETSLHFNFIFTCDAAKLVMFSCDAAKLAHDKKNLRRLICVYIDPVLYYSFSSGKDTTPQTLGEKTT